MTEEEQATTKIVEQARNEPPIKQDDEDVDDAEEEEVVKPTHTRISSLDLTRNHLAQKEQQQQPEDNAQPPTTINTTMRRTSSIELRRLPVDILLQPESGAGDDFSEASSLGDEDVTEPGGASSHHGGAGPQVGDSKYVMNGGWFSTLIRKTCLNPKLSLRTQLMGAFGTVNVITTILVVVLCMVVTISTGYNIGKINRNEFTNLAQTVEGTTARYLAENLNAQFLPLDVLRILYDVTQDRFDDELYSGSHTDIYTGTNIFPIQGPTIPLEWNLENKRTRVTDANYQEHMQGRWHSFYKSLEWVTTANAGLLIRGSCDPKQTNTSAAAYLKNCTKANNNISSGGVISPTDKVAELHKKSSDLVPLFKALFEVNENVRDLGLYYFNDGAGAAVNFPQFPLSAHAGYTSIGCEWMNEPNPYDPTRPIGTQEQIDQCVPEGQFVNSRMYNPMERAWCRDEALQPENIMIDIYMDSWNPGSFLLSLGRGIYHRQTNDFIGCSYVGISLDTVEATLREARLSPNSEVSLVKYDPEGTVVASSATGKNRTTTTTIDDLMSTSAATNGEGITTIDQLHIGLTKETYQQVYQLIDFSSEEEWDPIELRKKYESISIPTSDNYFVAAYPIPPIPTTYDPNYHPEMLVIMSTSKIDFFEIVDKVSDDIQSQTYALIIFSLIAGAIGWTVTTLLIIVMAHNVTSPLRYMNHVADEIMNNFGNSSNGKNPKLAGGDNTSNHNMDNYCDENITPAAAAAAPSTNNHRDNNQLVSTSTTVEGSDTTRKRQQYVQGKCAPRTELNMVVHQFDKMVNSFSGSLNARSEKGKNREVKNKFFLKEEFLHLYKQRDAPDFIYKVSSTYPKMEEMIQKANKRITSAASMNNNNKGGRVSFTSPNINFDDLSTTFVHVGKNVNNDPNETASKSTFPSSAQYLNMKDRKEYKSPLFIWIVILIVTPLLLTTVTITAVVISTVSKQFTESIQDAKDDFLSFRLTSMGIQADLRADNVRGLTTKAIQDLNILTRFGSWVFFDGIQRVQEAYSVMTTGVEECKTYEDYTECPYYQEHDICDCAWDPIPDEDQCQTYSFNTRQYQVPWFVIESHDTHPLTGNRSRTSFPEVSYSASTTAWWDDQTTVPGSKKLSFSEGYKSTYDRLRTISAVPILPTLFHYGNDMSDPVHGLYFAFEADGSFIGYYGCRNKYNPRYASWSSTEANGAYKLRPELCPIGKYGYDPRCRGWYHSGRGMSAMYDTSLHVTAPYKFAGADGYGQSATSPLIDPRTNEHVGQVLVDFQSTSIFTALESANTPLPENGFPTLLAVQDDTGEDTVIGPNFDFAQEAKSFAEVVLPFDYNCSNSIICTENNVAFQDIVRSMKAGKSGITDFYRTKSDGSIELIYMAYSPVTLKNIFPVDSSDFSRGVQSSEYIVYSLGLAASEADILEPFKLVEENTKKTIDYAIIILSVTILISAILVVFISYRVTSSITVPMLYLLDLVRVINKLDMEEDPPEVDHQWGSREIVKVSETMETLFKIVRAATSAFYAGDLEIAYDVLVDSLRLFRSLDNKKAIGVACNNLGNTLLGMYRFKKDSKLDKMCGLSNKDIIAKGKAYFYHAIQLGEKLYDEFYNAEGWTPRCLDFMQHLSNRYFNRAIFLLTIKDDHDKPGELEQLGRRDLEIARDMDLEVIAYGEEIGWARVDRVVSLHSVAITRAKGHNLLLEMGLEDEWELEDFLKETFNTVKKELARDSSDLFVDLSPAGRMQEIETELMAYYLSKKNYEMAAKIGIRLLLEDAYTLLDAQTSALMALILYVNTTPSIESLKRESIKKKLEKMMSILESDIEGQNQDDEDSGMFSASNASSAFHKTLSVTTKRRSTKASFSSWCMKQHGGTYVTMENF